MTVGELIEVLSNYSNEKEVVIRYETTVVYSELTTGEEDMIAKIDSCSMIFDSGDNEIVIAADLSKDIR